MISKPKLAHQVATALATTEPFRWAQEERWVWEVLRSIRRRGGLTSHQFSSIVTILDQAVMAEIREDAKKRVGKPRGAGRSPGTSKP